MSSQNAEQTGAGHVDERTARRARRTALIDAGINPYPITSEVTAHAAELEERYAALEAGQDTEDTYSIAGRIRALRNQGKAAFVVLEDHTGQIQLFCRIDSLPEGAWSLLGQLDLGDILGATGTVMRTRRGQLSLSPTSLTLLSKSCRPLPEKFHGLTDKEVRYRQRYVDLIMNPEVRDTFVKRSHLISAMRRFMESQGYLEVETPILQETLGGANARPFTTHFNALDQDCYLRIATELHLKRCIVGGMERVFELGRQFRNEGMDLTHNPEFTSMEAYCAYSDLEGMKRLSEGLFTACREAVGLPERFVYQGTEIDMAAPFRSAPMAELVSEKVGEHIDMGTSVEHAREILDRLKLEHDESWGIGRLIFTIYDELCEGDIVDPTFVCDYPVEVSPLAKRKDDDPRLTDRFELVVAGHEYANAFSELNDPVDQEVRFREQVAAKEAGDDEAMEYDYDFVRALEYGMPPAGGVGWGIDRMIMLFTDSASIRDVLLFPHMRPERWDNDRKETTMVEDRLESGLTRDQAHELLVRYNDDPFHVAHGETLEGLMRHYAAQHDPAHVDFWGQVGLLHDLDWERWQDEQLHTVKTAELLAEAGADPALARAIQTHSSDVNKDLPAPEHVMEKWLFACDELSGLIQASVKMRPSRSVMDFDVRSLKKKYKSKRFAAGCDRQVIARGAELLGMGLDELFASVIEAMRAIAPVGDIYAQPEGDEEQGPEVPQEGIHVEPLSGEEVDFVTFSRSDFRVVRVKECTAVPKSKKLLRFVLDDGSGTDRVILSGIKDYYRPEELVGKNLVAIVNLPPRTMMGIDSCGMIISAIHTEDGREGLDVLVVDDRIPAGAKLY